MQVKTALDSISLQSKCQRKQMTAGAGGDLEEGEHERKLPEEKMKHGHAKNEH